MSPDLKLAIQSAKKAGKIIKAEYAKSNKKITQKGSNDFVTKADKKSEQVIIRNLQKTGYSILSEEIGEINNQNSKKWVIDPLDGTSNFIRGIPFFAVSIALIRSEKRLLLGVIYDPLTEECYWAEENSGAYLNNKKITVSNIGELENSVILIEHGRSQEARKDYLNISNKLIQEKESLVLRQGATSLMLCYLAKGSCEAFLSCGDELYDYAAGLIIAKEAGAYISDWGGREWDNSNSHILASNPKIHDKILGQIAKD